MSDTSLNLHVARIKLGMLLNLCVCIFLGMGQNAYAGGGPHQTAHSVCGNGINSFKTNSIQQHPLGCTVLAVIKLNVQAVI